MPKSTSTAQADPSTRLRAGAFEERTRKKRSARSARNDKFCVGALKAQQARKQQWRSKFAATKRARSFDGAQDRHIVPLQDEEPARRRRYVEWKSYALWVLISSLTLLTVGRSSWIVAIQEQKRESSWSCGGGVFRGGMR
jgi:hypothetical protein